eukprot:gene7947-8145_t
MNYGWWLREVFNSVGLPKLLDTRCRVEFEQLRLPHSVNVPVTDVLKCCFLLPHQSTAFWVLVPRKESYRLVTNKSEESLAAEVPAVWLRGHCSLEAWVLSRWSNAQFVDDDTQLWASAARLGILEEGPVDPSLLARRCLFSPSPLLGEALPHIEAALRSTAKQLPVVAECLDIGCGSGRDMMYLCASANSRNSSGIGTSEELDKVRWKVTGLDSWVGALERAHDLAAAMLLPAADVALVYCKICSDTGSIQLQQLPGSSKLHGCTNATVVDAASACASSNGDSPTHKPDCYCESTLLNRFDVVVCVRFLERALLPRLKRFLKPGGFVVYSTFVDGPGLRKFGRPSGPEHVLEAGELAESFFGPDQGYSVIKDDIVLADDGRELSSFIAQLLLG